MTLSAQKQFLRFSMVGVAGFMIDAVILTLVNELAGPYLGRLISFTLAVIGTWLLNRNFTFSAGNGSSETGKSASEEFAQYFTAMIFGGSVNYGVYAGLVFFAEPVRQWPVMGVAAGSLAGLAINFLLARNWIFRSRK